MKRKILAILLACMLVASLSISASATEDKPYGGFSTTISSGLLKDTATSTISRCSCTPVDNYLMAGLQIQYVEDGDYNWNPSQSTYVYDSGYNVNSRTKSLSAGEIFYAEGWFQARCGDGTMWDDYDYAQ